MVFVNSVFMGLFQWPRLGLYLFVTMHWISAIGYGLFPLTGSGYDGSFQSFVHVYVITVLVVLLSIVSLILIAVGGFKSGNKVLAWFAVVAFLLIFFGGQQAVRLFQEHILELLKDSVLIVLYVLQL